MYSLQPAMYSEHHGIIQISFVGHGNSITGLILLVDILYLMKQCGLTRD